MKAAGSSPRRLFVYNGGLLLKSRAKRILELSGWQVRTGKPAPDDKIGVWGMSPTAPRGQKISEVTGVPVVRVEDAFLRSLFPGRSGEPGLGLLIDEIGVHFDSSKPSGLETLLAEHPFDDTAILNRAREAVEFMKRHHLTKYAAVDPTIKPPPPGYVVVIDQTRGDASVEYGGAISTTFKEMLVHAQMEHPDAQIIIKSHPETTSGHREGYFSNKDETDRVTILDDPISPWVLFENARAVYTVSSGLGFEAIFAGHKPRVFGQPFYAGWGLTQDENPIGRRERKLTKSQLFAGAMILAPTWYDPYRDRLCELETVLQSLAAQARAWRQDKRGWVMTGISQRKKKRMKAMFGRFGPLSFANESAAIETAAKSDRPLMVWAGKMPEDFPLRAAQENVTLNRLEDGFIRSRGLGAALVPAMSLCADPKGIYYDPLPESDLETLIQNSVDLDAGSLARSSRLIASLTRLGLSKYNQGVAVDDADWPEGPRVLVVGQVEDDASVKLGCKGKVRTNLDLLRAAKSGVPNGVIIYKPHPDVLAGFRAGAVSPDDLAQYADVILGNCDPADVLTKVEAVWTMTSAMGFEALLRGLPVTCVGSPFYAGWGLTRDYGPTPGRRTAKPTQEGLVHATLIDYPRYFDPVTGMDCPVEVVVERLRDGGETPGLFGTLWSLWKRIKRSS